MAISQAIAAGSQRNQYNTNLMNPYAIMPMLAQRNTPRPHTVIPGGYRRPGTRQIRDNAAELALKERELDLKDREMRLKEIQERNRTMETRRAQAEVDSQGVQNRYQTAMNNAQDRYMKDTAVNTAMDQDQMGKDYDMAKWGLANRQAGPIVNFFNKHGDPNTNIEDIQFEPQGEGMLVHYAGAEKPEHYKDRKQFMTGLLAFASPKVINAMAKNKTGEGEGKRQKQMEDIRSDAIEAYQDEWMDPMGNPKPNAPDRNQYIQQYVGDVTGQGASNAPPTTGEAIQGRAGKGVKPEQPQGKEQRFKDKRTGNTLVKRPDGSMELFDPEGNLLRKRTADGQEMVSKVSQAVEKPSEGAAIEGRKKSGGGTAEYTDPKSGEKVRVKMNPDGTTKKEVIEEDKSEKTKRGKKRKKKKNKRR